MSETRSAVSGGLDRRGPAGANLLFLREEQIRLAQDMLFFAYRDFTGAADMILEELGLGRAHHRALHFIGRTPFMRSAPNRFGQAQQAIARWILVCCAETESCSAPRHAIGRT